MKKLLALLLALLTAVSLVGCDWMDGAYVSVKPHQVGYSQNTPDRTVVTSYSSLRKAVASLIDSGEAEGVLTLSAYPEADVRTDMEKVIAYCQNTYPMGAYAVEAIHYELGQGLLSLHIDYRRSKAQMDRIQTVRGVSGAQEAIAKALTDCADKLVLQVTLYTDMDVVQYIADYAGRNPNVVMELPQVTVQVYPQTGTTRILELDFAYQTSRESLRDMLNQVRQVFSSARLYVSGDTGDSVKLTQLYSFLMERFDYVIETSITPAYSLLSYGVGDSRAFAQVYAAMCRQSGLEVMVVSGTCRGESRFWNIVLSGGSYYHVDLLECAAQGRYEEKSDEEMTGYVWDYSAYPACGPNPQPREMDPEE